MWDSSAPKAVNPASRKAGTRARILIVDDEETLRDVWQEALTEEGYWVETAESPEAALGKLDKERFDLVLLDEVFKAGPFDGLDAFRQIKRLCSSLPVIMMTGYPDVEENIARAIKEGAYRQVIRKPSTVAEITRIVSECLAERSREE